MGQYFALMDCAKVPESSPLLDSESSCAGVSQTAFLPWYVPSRPRPLDDSSKCPTSEVEVEIPRSTFPCLQPSLGLEIVVIGTSRTRYLQSDAGVCLVLGVLMLAGCAGTVMPPRLPDGCRGPWSFLVGRSQVLSAWQRQTSIRHSLPSPLPCRHAECEFPTSVPHTWLVDHPS